MAARIIDEMPRLPETESSEMHILIHHPASDTFVFCDEDIVDMEQRGFSTLAYVFPQTGDGGRSNREWIDWFVADIMHARGIASN